MNAKNITRNLRNALAYRPMLNGKGYHFRRYGARWLCCDWNMGR
ncbi:hypothetical protein CPT_Silvanus_065 [Stenotrophomonas phage Silvanus]|nr:hypothetical protein CPT_Silvanus_065 [Stenotrophomonas phage Silvanus]